MLKQIKSFLKKYQGWEIEVYVFIAEEDVSLSIEAIKKHPYISDYDKTETIHINETEYQDRWVDGEELAKQIEKDFLKLNDKLNLNYTGIGSL
jgi:hypothetical protein